MRIGLGTVAAVVLCAPPLSALDVVDIRVWSLAEATRVAVEVSGSFQIRSDRLQNPDRIFFDILDARPRVDNKPFWTQDVNDKFVKRIRVAETQPNVTRVVLDLEGNVAFTASQLGNPDRLMIELRAGPPQAEAAPAPEVAAPVPEKPLAIPKPAARTSAGGSSLVRALGLKVRRVVLDAGHGGHDEGTVGRSGLMEKDLSLDLVKRLGGLIEERMGSEVIYTRIDDTFIPLEARTALANEKKADLFLSIHANSSRHRSVAGVETFYLNFTNAPDALDVASRENAGSDRTIHELGDLIKTITRHDKAEESREFAGIMQSSLHRFVRRYVSTAKNRGVKKAPFVVLIGATMPSILVEVGFLTNAREEALLNRPEHRERVAEALFQGLSRYAETLSHFQVAQQPVPDAKVAPDRE